MHAELQSIRAQLVAALATVDRLIATPATDEAIDISIYRASPGGPLSEAGIEEMYRRFRAGEPDGTISAAMGVSVQGVQKRRTIWRRTR